MLLHLPQKDGLLLLGVLIALYLSLIHISRLHTRLKMKS